MPLTVDVEVPPRDREVLASWVRSPSIRAGLAQRARIVLLADDGLGTNEIVRRAGVSKPTVIAWKRRYSERRTLALARGFRRIACFWTRSSGFSRRNKKSPERSFEGRSRETSQGRYGRSRQHDRSDADRRLHDTRC